MTKAEIVAKISEKTGIEKKEVMAIVEAFMYAVKNSMCDGKNVYLRGFGTLYIKKTCKETRKNYFTQYYDHDFCS